MRWRKKGRAKLLYVQGLLKIMVGLQVLTKALFWLGVLTNTISDVLLAYIQRLTEGWVKRPPNAGN